MNFLKAVLGVATAMLLTVGAFGQPYPPAPYADATTTGITDSVTLGTTSGFYVLPDPYFHPNYVAAGTLTANFAWNWAIAPAGPTLSAAQTATNYVTVAFTGGTAANTTYALSVNEQASPAFGGCTGANVTMNIRVLATPTVAFTGGAGFINADIEACEGATTIDNELVQATLTGIRRFQLQWRLQIHTLASDHTTIDKYWDDDKTTVITLPTYALDYDGTAGTQAVVNAATLSLNTAGYFTCITDGTTKRSTVYTYTLRGVNDRISRKSDYLTNPTASATAWSWYDTAVKTVVITVNPAPVTGPIYHIPNNWNF